MGWFTPKRDPSLEAFAGYLRTKLCELGEPELANVAHELKDYQLVCVADWMKLEGIEGAVLRGVSHRVTSC